MAKHRHNWSLVGPWYRDSSVGGGAPERSVKPIIQKYAGSNFANEILKEPQRSLKFVGEDFVNPKTMPLDDPVAANDARINNNPLKLYLDSHDRFYLVVCELHCDAPGFPNVTRDKVMQAGFVVRKRVKRFDKSAGLQVEGALQAQRVRHQKISRMENQMRASQAKAAKGGVSAPLYKRVARVQSKQLNVLGREAYLNQLEQFGIEYLAAYTTIKMGWCDNQGEAGEQNSTQPVVWNWDEVEEEPEDLNEAYFPLYPLIPDPNDKAHSAHGKTIWFGVVPTSNSDVNENGFPRFDEGSDYEVRCFVRRHRPCCEKPKAKGGCCRGELVWSEATEPYRVAPFFDLYGCGHKPINITLPDLNALKNQMAKAPVGKGANVNMKTPPNSGMAITMPDDTDDAIELPESTDLLGNNGGGGGGSVCFFAIPLITIVAMFVLKLFLPIVVFVFQLWFLLSLRLCIPPSISLDVGLAAELKLIPPSFDFDAKISAGFSLGGVWVNSKADFRKVFNDGFDTKGTLDVVLKNKMLDKMENGDNKIRMELIQVMLAVSADYADEPTQPGHTGTLSKATDGLHYFERLERSV